MELRGFSVGDPNLPQKKLVDNVSFSVREGEVRGAQVLWAPAQRFANGGFGAHPGRFSGDILIDGKKVNISSPADAIACGIALSPRQKTFWPGAGPDHFE